MLFQTVTSIGPTVTIMAYLLRHGSGFKEVRCPTAQTVVILLYRLTKGQVILLQLHG